MTQRPVPDGEALPELIISRLAALQPSEIALTDESAQHAGHAGATGGNHYRLRIVSAAFVGKSSLQRHRAVHAALGDLMRCRIHALCIEALTPPEER